jgi:hypothetical protein
LNRKASSGPAKKTSSPPHSSSTFRPSAPFFLFSPLPLSFSFCIRLLYLILPLFFISPSSSYFYSNYCTFFLFVAFFSLYPPPFPSMLLLFITFYPMSSSCILFLIHCLTLFLNLFFFASSVFPFVLSFALLSSSFPPPTLSFFLRHLLVHSLVSPLGLLLRHPLFSIKSSSSLSCDRSIASSKLSSPKREILSFLLQLPVSSCFHEIIQQLITSPSSPSCPYNLSFNDATQKAVPTQYVPNPAGLPSSYCVKNVPFLLYSV